MVVFPRENWLYISTGISNIIGFIVIFPQTIGYIVVFPTDNWLYGSISTVTGYIVVYPRITDYIVVSPPPPRKSLNSSPFMENWLFNSISPSI